MQKKQKHNKTLDKSKNCKDITNKSNDNVLNKGFNSEEHRWKTMTGQRLEVLVMKCMNQKMYLSNLVLRNKIRTDVNAIKYMLNG